MLVSGRALTIKTPIDLSQDVTQILIDMEVFFAGLGLTFDLRCIPCARAGDGEAAYCSGSVNEACDEFTVECGCSRRVGRGAFIVPTPPDAPAQREPLDDGRKRVERISREQMTHIQTFETVLKGLKLQYTLRCMRCRMNDEPSDGVRGVGEKTAFVLECACCRRVGDAVTVN